MLVLRHELAYGGIFAGAFGAQHAVQPRVVLVCHETFKQANERRAEGFLTVQTVYPGEKYVRHMAETVIGYGDDKFVLGGIVVIKCALAQLCFGCDIAKAGAVDALLCKEGGCGIEYSVTYRRKIPVFARHVRSSFRQAQISAF